MDIIKKIAEECKGGNIVFFLGSGISIGNDFQMGFPSGFMLSKILSKDLLNREPFQNETLMQISQQIIWKNNGSRQPLESYLLNIFLNPNVMPLQTHQYLAELNTRMITTNYDRLIEEAFRNSNLKLSTIINDGDLIHSEENILIKIHGCISQVQNCVITEEDYYRWMSFDTEMKNLVRAWLLMFRIVFIGYSLGDINFRQLIVELRRKFGGSFKNCYIVTPNIDKDSYDYKFLKNVIGAQFIQLKAHIFFSEILSKLPPNYKNYIDTNLKDEYFSLNAHNRTTFNRFAAERIFEKIFSNQCGQLELNSELADEIYSLAAKKQKDIYIKNPAASQSEGMIHIPAGEFIMGGSRLGNERIRIEHIPYDYFIDEFPVTNKQYRKFYEWIKETGDYYFCHPMEPPDKNHKPAPEANFEKPKDINYKLPPKNYFTDEKYNDYPVVFVDWWDAYAYSKWAGKRLPTEKEWEKAARGIDGRIFPYGNTFDTHKCNVAETGIYSPTPYDRFLSGKSPYGCIDMCGNIWEWCHDMFDLSQINSGQTRVVKGGSCTRGKVKAPCSFRNGRHPHERWMSRGFRCVKSLD